MHYKVLILVIASLVIVNSHAIAQSMSLAVDDAGTLVRSFDIVTGEQFDTITLIDTGGSEISGVEWVQTEPLGLSPGFFKLGTTKICDTCDQFGGVPGEYILGLGWCEPPSEALELVRCTYADFGGEAPSDIVLTLRGFGPGDSYPSSFDGDAGFVDCADTGFPVGMAGGDAWETGSGAIVPSGALVLNPTPPLVVGTDGHGISHLKARFR